MKTPLAFFSTLLVALVAVLPAKAQNQPAATNVALATELVSVMHLEQSIGQGLGMMKQMQGKLAASASTNSSPESTAMMQKTMDNSMNAASSIMSWEKMKPIYVNAYASIFTTEELQGAVDFFKTPIGQQWVQKQPQVSMAIMAKTTEMMVAAQPQMMEAMKKSMAALDALRKSTNSFSTNLPLLPSAAPQTAPTN